jgi:hypothetical protein
MPNNIQSPTLIIGLGGTGVAVLRKFKQRYIELYGTDERLVKLLAIDTAGQPKMEEAPLATNEFFHLGNPQIDVAAVIRTASSQPALDWLRDTKIPGFAIAVGAGMKRFYGHIAYFFRGISIRQRIEKAVSELMHASGKLAAQGPQAGFRVYIVSSLCGGTGTGMYLDIAYMASDVVTKAGLGTPQSFGFLFLPSAFQELKSHDFWNSINANGYAALQELQYYMTMKQRPELPNFRMPDNQHTTIQLNSEPFQYCYLVGGVNEVGHPVAKSADLYDRTAEFLFMTATSDIGSQLAAVTVNGDKCFASFGSCNLQLPQARSLQKYFLLMGREVLNDVFGDAPEGFVPPRISEKLAGVTGYASIEQLQNDSAAYLEEEVFVRYNMHASDSRQALATIDHLLAELKSAESRYKERQADRFSQIENDVRALINQEITSAWNLEKGTIQRVIQGLDVAISELSDRRKSLQLRSNAADLDTALTAFKSPSKWAQLFKKGNAQLASFKDAAVSAFESRVRAFLASEYSRMFAAITNELQQLKEKLQDLSRRKLEALDNFQVTAQAHLVAIAQEQGNLGLLDPANISEDDDYQADRRGLLMRCRSRQEIRASIGSPDKAAISINALVKGLFSVVDEFVEQKVFKGHLVDDEFYGRLAQSKVNLQIHDLFEQPRRESYLFMNGTEELQEGIISAIESAPDGFQSIQSKPGVNPGTATFVRLVAGFKLKDLVEMEQMASAYEIKTHTADAIYLDLPTHRRAAIVETSNENLGAELFAFGQILIGIMDVGQNYLVHGRRLLLNDEADPVKRRKAAYEAVLNPDYRSEIEQARNATAQNLGGNAAFVPFIQGKLKQYDPPEGNDAYKDILLKEKSAVETYLSTLPVQSQTAGV